MNSLVGTFVSAWVNPWASMRRIRDEGPEASIRPAVTFIVTMGVIGGIITSIMGMIFPPAEVQAGTLPKAMVWLAIIIVPVFSFIASFFAAFIIWGLVAGYLRGTKSEYNTVYRLLAVPAAFSPAAALLAYVPKVGQWLVVAINIWATIVTIQGLIIVMNTKPVRTWVMCILFFVFVILMGVLLGAAFRQQGEGGRLGDFEAGNLGAEANPDLAGGGGGAGGGDDELNKQLQDLADQAKDQKTAEPKTQQPAPKK